ncbi:transposase (plasmid) [Xanthomonas citri pv. citri]|nr:transposase [Xanthomonas citri pv. citri]OLR69332.1 transposase [Xanthomonas citri pv. citri]OLR69385.1 transposase [Xanthomonas citri pv. citri]OLR69441.1 transposase [Xanthomonas citri pv. citri]
MKSIDQTWLMASGTATGSGRSRTSRFFGLIRRFNSNSR